MEETFSVYQSGTSYNITCLKDDTIECVRYRIGEVVGVHPDRLRIYVQLEFPGDYYEKDPRRWENLFLRMSPEGKAITTKSLAAYNSARDPQIDFQAEYGKTAWMTNDHTYETSFRELRLFGVPEQRSWIYPLSTEEPEHLPPASLVSIDVKALYKTLHPQKIIRFEVIPYSELPQVLELIYFPRYRSATPLRVPSDTLRQIKKETDLVVALLGTSVPKPDKTTITNIRWKLPLIDTDFGNAIRNRFEQIFYGTTLSEKVPVISFFGGRQEQSRHKFYTKTEDKTPFLDVKLWNYWWNATKPSKNRPSLVCYRGTSRNEYDRITINAIEITLSSSRTTDEKVEDLRNGLKEFLLEIDGITSYLSPMDYDDERWELQDSSLVLHYDKELKEADFRRFDCLRSIYDTIDSEKLAFKFLRSDQSDTGLSPGELRVIQLLKENEYTSAEDVREQLPELTLDSASALLLATRQKLDDNPDLVDRQYADLPTFRFSAKQAVVLHCVDMPRMIRYISALRDVFIHPDNPELDEVCPKRVEEVATETAVVPVNVVEVTEEDDYLDDLLGEVADVEVVAPTREEPKPVKATKVVKARGAKTTLANYFSTQLREFDPLTFDPEDTDVFKKCQKPQQPVILPTAELERFTEDLAQYDPRNLGSSNVKEIENGLIVCPEFWCTIDRIPLVKEQLIDGACPVCKGKVRSSDSKTEKTQDTTEYPVIQRDPTYVYPGYVKYKTKTNRNIPCCFKTPQATRISVLRPSEPTLSSEAFYILGEGKTRLEELRVAYIPRDVILALKLPADYRPFVDNGNRIQTGQAGFFRAGVGHASTSLPKILELTGTLKTPIQNPDVVLRCSFFRTWKGEVDADIPGYSRDISRRIASIDSAFREKTLQPLEELEYVSLALECLTFVLFVSPDGVYSSCFMNIGAVRRTNRSALVIVDDTDKESIDYIAHISRTSTQPIVRGNLYLKLFPPELLALLNTFRIKTCIRDIPTIDDVFIFLSKTEFKDKIASLTQIIDPYNRLQALFLPNKFILPFRPTSQAPTIFSSPRVKYSDISQETYPQKLEMISMLNSAKATIPGLEYAHDAGNSRGNVVEIITKSGLRIPVLSGDTSETFEEVTETTIEKTEDTLAFGKPDEKALNLARSITYDSEIYDFLLFQLTKDIQLEDYASLRSALVEKSPDLQPLLREWMNTTIKFSEAESPPAFYNKIRKACTGQTEAKCSGLCIWDGASCKVQVKKVRSDLHKEALEKRMLSTLMSNEKIREVIFEEKISPFFSSILYLELPHEVILSDQDINDMRK
ncbi:MAG: hypothetical protein EBS86_03340 [Crocinitomicaceae bacterium]|nr:hypothetical protein [Crocinitomicaceae bacterium]